MRIIALINEADVIEKILKHLGFWRNAEQARAPPTIEVTMSRFMMIFPFSQSYLCKKV